MKMLGRDGKVVDVPDQHVQEAFQSRKFGFLPGSKVPVAYDDGQVGHVEAKDALAAYQAGARTATPQEIHNADIEEKYGGIAGGALAAGEGVARGLSVGLADPLAVGAARAFGGKQAEIDTRAHLRDVKEAHPYLSAGGEIAGAVAPILASGGMAAPAEGANLARAGVGAAEAAQGARALTAGVDAVHGAGLVRQGVSAAGMLPRGIAAVGRGAEDMAASLVGQTSDSLIGRIAQKAVKHAASGSVETALFSAGQEVSEATLGDHELTAEKVLAAMGHGALVGGMLGGALGAGGHLAAEGGSAVLKNMAPRLEKAAGEQMWKALNPIGKLTKEAEARAGGTAAVGRTVLEEAMPKEAGVMKSAMTAEDLLPHISEAKTRIGGQIGDLVSQTKATVPAMDIFEPLHGAIESFKKQAGFEPVVRSLTEYRNSLAEKFGIVQGGKVMPWAERHVVPVQELIEQRRSLQELVYQETKALNPNMRVGTLRNFARSMGDTEIKAIDQAAKELGGPTGQELKVLNKKYQHLSLAEDAAKDSTARAKTNNSFSIMEYGGAMSAVAAGHPLAAPVVALGHKLIRERGNSVAAVMLDRASSLGVLRRYSAKVDKEIAAGVEGVLGKKAGKKLSPRTFRLGEDETEHPRDRYESHVDRIAMAASAPRLKAEHAEQHLGNGVAAHAPETMKALASAAQAGTSFLATKIPKGHSDLRSLTPQLERPRISDAEMDKFLKYQNAVDDPTSVIRDMEHGKISREGVEALQKVYPKLYAQVRQAFIAKLGSMKEPPGYAQRVQLGILMGIPTDATLQPEFVKSMQSTFAGKTGDPKGAAAPAPGHLAPGPHKPIQGIAQSNQTVYGAVGTPIQ